jgi:hypothetical protein
LLAEQVRLIGGYDIRILSDFISIAFVLRYVVGGD